MGEKRIFNQPIQVSDAFSIVANGTTAISTDANGVVSIGGTNYQASTAANAVAGGAGSTAYLTKTITGIADDTATTILTVTIPNPGTGSFNACVLDLSLLGICGAGGSIGAGEFITTACGSVGITRTPGLASVINISSLTQTTSVNVAGGDTAVAITLTNVAVSGGNTATQTFALQVTIDDDTASGTNHICVVQAALTNANGSGITIA